MPVLSANRRAVGPFGRYSPGVLMQLWAYCELQNTNIRHGEAAGPCSVGIENTVNSQQNHGHIFFTFPIVISVTSLV